jgi:hypothetical protein
MPAHADAVGLHEVCELFLSLNTCAELGNVENTVPLITFQFDKRIQCAPYDVHLFQHPVQRRSIDGDEAMTHFAQWNDRKKRQVLQTIVTVEEDPLPENVELVPGLRAMSCQRMLWAHQDRYMLLFTEKCCTIQ